MIFPISNRGHFDFFAYQPPGGQTALFAVVLKMIRRKNLSQSAQYL